MRTREIIREVENKKEREGETDRERESKSKEDKRNLAEISESEKRRKQPIVRSILKKQSGVGMMG